MKYCYKCGKELILKECFNCNGQSKEVPFGDKKISEGKIPYCENCKEYRFPIFNTAISMVIFNKNYSKILLIKQYKRDWNVLVAGYTEKGECLEETLKRELKEEVNLIPLSFEYNESKYFEKTNTLICNFIVNVRDENFVLNGEVDEAFWYDTKIAKNEVLQNSLASYFLGLAIKKVKAKN